MKKIIYLFSLLAVLGLNACINLDVPPKDKVTDEDLLSNEAGMSIYMARMYSNMPFEDFKYMGEWGFEFNGWLAATGIDGTGESVNRDGICRAFTGERKAYWGMAYVLLRDANYLIENLPRYRDNFVEITYNHYLGEAYFVRGVVFSAMARRFGGIPLVTKVIKYPAPEETLQVARSSEEDTWNQVCKDFDTAIELLQPASPLSGNANKYVAAAFKAEAMLYAGSVAKYNEVIPSRLTGFGQKTGVRVIGFDVATAATASKRYFTESYKAAMEVVNSGKYDLYKVKWAANDREAQYQNMVQMFSDISSANKENILVKEYSYPTMTHGYDAYSSTLSFRAPLAGGTCPTLDFVELYEGFQRYADGTLKVTDGVSNTEGNYLMYDNPIDLFANAEPRLRAYVIFPGDQFKGKETEIRAGIYTGPTPVKPFFDDYSYASAETRYQNLPQYKNKPKSLYLSPSTGASHEIVEVDGKKMTAGGLEGPFYDFAEATLTGFYGRKWLNPDPTTLVGEGKSAQPFILMRYAEVLLTAAEAAIELSLAGVASPDGTNMLQVATDNINAIRERAGASLLSGVLSANDASRDIVRKERRKELALEHKTKWDLRRWRVNHYENRDGFWGEKRDKNSYSNNTRYRFRGLYPFYSSQAKKYFFDARYQWTAIKTFEYNIVDYYFAIPGGEVTKSPLIDQQPNR